MNGKKADRVREKLILSAFVLSKKEQKFDKNNEVFKEFFIITMLYFLHQLRKPKEKEGVQGYVFKNLEKRYESTKKY